MKCHFYWIHQCFWHIVHSFLPLIILSSSTAADAVHRQFCLFLPFFSFFHFPAFISGFCSFRLFLFFFLFFCILAFSAIACFSTGFLDASSHLYKRVCPSVRPSICPLPLRKNRRGTHLIARPGLFLPLLVLNFFLDESLHLCKRVCVCVHLSDRLQLRTTADNGDFSLENDCDQLLIHFGRIILPARACFLLSFCRILLSFTVLGHQLQFSAEHLCANEVGVFWNDSLFARLQSQREMAKMKQWSRDV